MPSRPTKFQYRRPSRFLWFARLTKDELNDIDGFVELASEARKSQEERLDRLAAQIRRHAPDDDRLVDDFAQLDDFAALSAEFAIIGLWRCVELYTKTATFIASGKRTAARTFRYKYKEFQRELSRLGIPEQRIRCARSVDELRCLNNAIKHSRRVDDGLGKFPRWRGKRGRELGNVEGHYARLRSAAERYLNDLAGRLSRRMTTGDFPRDAKRRSERRLYWAPLKRGYVPFGAAALRVAIWQSTCIVAVSSVAGANITNHRIPAHSETTPGVRNAGRCFFSDSYLRRCSGDLFQNSAVE